MLRAGTETGSLVNHLYSRYSTPVPEVGMGATVLLWSDRRPATIIKLTRTQIHVQEDTATRTDSNGMSESQQYTYEPNPHGRITVFRKTKRGWRGTGSAGLAIGFREKYHDFSF